MSRCLMSPPTQSKDISTCGWLIWVVSVVFYPVVNGGNIYSCKRNTLVRRFSLDQKRDKTHCMLAFTLWECFYELSHLLQSQTLSFRSQININNDSLSFIIERIYSECDSLRCLLYWVLYWVIAIVLLLYIVIVLSNNICPLEAKNVWGSYLFSCHIKRESGNQW